VSVPVIERLSGRLHEVRDGYGAPDQPLAGYALLMAGFATVAGGGLAYGARKGSRFPERPSLGDIALLAVATQGVARVVTKDRVTSVLRSPVAEYDHDGPPGEVVDRARGQGMRKAAGELLTCPYCFGQWVAMAFTIGLAYQPRPTRAVATAAAVATLADTFQAVYARITP
jgi:hypothetical protein